MTHRTNLGAGVVAEVDVLSPHQWSAVTLVAQEHDADPLLHALVGDHEAARLRADGSVAQVTPAEAAAPWLRLAVVEALNRWLHLTLDASLVDAERAVSRARAAATLPGGPTRTALLGEALRLARHASDGVVALLRRLGRQPPAPEGLLSALGNLVDGYAALRAEVRGPDGELAAVVDGWRRLTARTGEAGRPPPTLTASPLRSAVPAVGPRPTSLIDPRQVPSRFLALSPEPAVAEIAVTLDPDDPASVLVRAPAFGPVIDQDARYRLMARVVDRRTAEAKGHAPAILTIGRPGATAVFEATVPLCGLDLTEVRADLYDPRCLDRPEHATTDTMLMDARRAVVFLAELRQLISFAQLHTVPAPGRRLRDMALRLRSPGAPEDQPMFVGGPSFAAVEGLAALEDEQLLRKLRSPRAGGSLAVARGAAGLLAAELATACISTSQ